MTARRALTLTLLTSCVASGRASDAFCLVATPILVSPSDQLSAETAREILRHNATGERLCDW